MQAEIATELLNKDDTTTIGVLLAFIVILIAANVIQWKKQGESDKYIREQDRANLEMLSSLAKNAELLGQDLDKVKDYTVETKPRIIRVLEILENRLLNGHIK